MIVSGIALEPHTISHGISGINKIYPEDELRDATQSLEGCNITSSRGDSDIIGEVLNSSYKEGDGVTYDAEIMDEWGIRVETGELQIAPRLVHNSVNNTDDQPIEVYDVRFENLFLCSAATDGVPGIGDWSILSR